MKGRVDIIVFGATGYTGKYVVSQLCKLQKSKEDFTWGIAGRSEQKLKRLLRETASKNGKPSLDHVPIIIADVSEEESLRKMTSCAKIIIDCCGPFLIYGETVVKSCIETGTHFVDISAEPQFIQNIEDKYFEAAKRKGIYIVSACGLGFLPSDIGLAFMEKSFKEILNSAELYLHGSEEGGISDCPKAHYGTWESFVQILQNPVCLLQQVRATNKQLPKVQPSLSRRFPLTTIAIPGKSKKWILPMPLLDNTIIKRSQLYFYKQSGKRPIQIRTYLMLDSFKSAVMSLLAVLMCCIFSQFNFGRKLLLEYPETFSMGFFSKKEPPEEKLNRMHFSYSFYCEGWHEELLKNAEYYKKPPSKAIIGQVNGVNPGYGFTATAIALCALSILTQPEKLPPKGGVYTTAAAFSKTLLIEDLQKHGTEFKIISIKDL